MPNTPITQIPLQLEEYFLKKLDIEWREFPPEGEFKANGLHVDVTYDLRVHVENPHAYQMTLTVSGEQVFEKVSNVGIRFLGVIAGRYRMESAKPEQEAILARINGVSLLYSTFRGLCGMVSGSFEHGKIDLPSIDPRAVVRRVEEARASVGGDSSTPPVPQPIDTEKN